MQSKVKKVTAFITRNRNGFSSLTYEDTPESWELVSDLRHTFKPFWTPLVPKPYVIPQINLYQHPLAPTELLDLDPGQVAGAQAVLLVRSLNAKGRR